MDFINKSNSLAHNTLSIQLQAIESYSVLDIIMPLLQQKGIRPYTIHDSFVCKESEAKAIEEIFTSKLIELNGFAPTLRLSFIDAIEDDKDDIIEDWDDAFIDELNVIVEQERRYATPPPVGHLLPPSPVIHLTYPRYVPS